MDTTFFYIQQLEKRINELEGLRYRNKIEINRFIFKEDLEQMINPKVPNYEDQKEIVKKEFWSGRDKYVWLHVEVSLPEAFIGKNIVGYFDFGNTGVGNNSSFESMIYLNKKEYQGVDSNHKEVFFDLDACGQTFELDFRLWSGLEGGGKKQDQYHQYKEAFIAQLDQATDDLYYMGKNIIETLHVLTDEDPIRYKLENVLKEAMKRVDYTNIQSDMFYESIKNASDYLNVSIDKLDRKDLIDIICVGHTHIDVAWLWRLKHTREKISRSFSTVLNLMDRYEEYYFLQTQAQLYEYIKNDFPEIYTRIKAKVKEGKWEPSGSMWVEADCNLTSGESIVRQILYGKKFFKDEFDFENTFLWLPDVFGYSWALPQILTKSGIDTFITTKISWNEVNRMPNDTFIWRGIDGSEILTHFVTTPDVDSTTKFYTYNGNIKPQIVKGIWNNYRNKDVNQSLLLSYGYGDGGGGVNRDMLENRRRIDKLPSMPVTKTGTVTKYLEKLHEDLNAEENLGHMAVWDNELYLEFHRGTYTSQAYNKLMNRKLELAYRDAEILSIFSGINKKDMTSYPVQSLYQGWKIILRNQFHDIIPGSSIQEVYEDSRQEYKEAEQIVRELFDDLAGIDQSNISIINTALWNREELICIEDYAGQNLQLVNQDNSPLMRQISENTCYFHIDSILPLGTKNYQVKNETTLEDCQNKSRFTYKNNSVESKHCKITWNNQGQLIEIFDKATNQNILTDTGNELQIFEDKPREYDAWELEATIDDKKEIIHDFTGAKLISEGPLFIKIRFGWKYNKTTMIQDMILYHHSKRIDFATRVQWKERDKVLKVAFPVDVRAINARYDIQFGSVERPTHRSTSWDAAKFEVVGHQWANIEEKGLGVALLNNCKYGYDIKENTMRLTLLKSATFPDPTADLGEQHFTYSIFVHQEAWNQSRIIEEAWAINAPLKVLKGKNNTLNNKEQLFDVQGSGVTLDAIKKTEDGNKILIRLHEMHGGKSLFRMQCNFEIKNWYECDLMENPIGEQVESPAIEMKFKPFEIKTYIIEV